MRRTACRLAGVLLVALAVVSTAASHPSAWRSSTASWYGPGLYGNTMACGGTLATSTNAVAHKTLRCGTRLVVCYRTRCVRTVVRDRGPFVAGRELDLAAGLAGQLRFRGVDRVRWRIG